MWALHQDKRSDWAAAQKCLWSFRILDRVRTTFCPHATAKFSSRSEAYVRSRRRVSWRGDCVLWRTNCSVLVVRGKIFEYQCAAKIVASTETRPNFLWRRDLASFDMRWKTDSRVYQRAQRTEQSEPAKSCYNTQHRCGPKLQKTSVPSPLNLQISETQENYNEQVRW